MTTQASDAYAGFQSGLQTPVRKAFPITPDDVNELPFVTRAIYVGGSGAIRLRLADDPTPQVLTAVPVGTVLPLRVRQVYATGTGATFMVGSY
jgi:hypothetical protein